MRTVHRNGGFTLIEVMVSVVILAIGLLGLAGLQSVSLRNNQSAYQRSQATLLAYALADRIRANKVGFDAGNYNNPTGAKTASCLTTVGCTPAQMALNDVAEWDESIAAALPGGTGKVCLDSTPDSAACDGSGDLYVIRVQWVDERDGSQKAFVTNFKP